MSGAAGERVCARNCIVVSCWLVMRYKQSKSSFYIAVFDFCMVAEVVNAVFL